MKLLIVRAFIIMKLLIFILFHGKIFWFYFWTLQHATLSNGKELLNYRSFLLQLVPPS